MTGEQMLRDPLTGAHSRATLQDRLREEVERSRRYGLPLSLLILDLDHFKTVNDAFGHTRGDLVLVAFVERVRGLARDSDLLFRYGGDEFVLLLLHTDRAQALAFAGRLLEGIRSTPFPGTPPLTLTLSIGAASFPDDGQTGEDLFERADRRLYDAKHHGRGRVIADDPVAPGRLTFDAASRMMERELPLVKLKQFLDDLPANKRGTFSIAGPTGIGKTWFLTELAKSARLRGYAVWPLRARAALRTRVFGALAEALPPVEGLPPPAAGEQEFIRALQAGLHEQAKAGLVLAVDNLAELDRASVGLLWRLLFAPEVGVAALAYTVEPNSPNRAPPFDAPLTAHVDLRPLSPLGVRLWLRGVLRWEAPEGVAGWLHRQTGGVPGRLERAISYLMDHELLRAQDSGWSLADGHADLPLAAILDELARPAPHNLPTPATDFVGREAELGALKRAIAAERLITVVGPGGMGKTRLALQAAAEVRETFADGAYFVPLASVTAVDDLLSNLANAIGLAFVGLADARRQLLARLARRHLLLVLDDFEHQLEGGSLLADLRAEAPGVTLLVTARERLNLPEESIFEVRGLPLPPSLPRRRRRDNRPAGDYAAEQLFVHSARRVMPDFALAEEDRLYVRRICELVEGMPLGIELAAAWTPLFTCREIAQQIERSLDFLSTGREEVPERQRSARAVLDYFWSLLGEDERRRLRSLAVFRGGFTLEAAQRTADASLFFLSALVDKAFLRKTQAGRYEMQELLRQYSEAKLREAADETQAANDCHSNYFADFLAEMGAELKGGRQVEALAAINADVANVRAAWRWATTHAQAAAIERSLDSLWRFYMMQGWYHEGAETFGRAAEIWQAAGPQEAGARAMLARLLTGHAAFLNQLGLNERALGLARQGLGLLDGLGAGGDNAAAAQARQTLGQVLLDLGQYGAARDWLRQALTAWQALSEDHGAAAALDGLGAAAHALGEYKEAEQLFAQELSLRRALNDRHGMVSALARAGELALDTGDLGAAQQLLDESQALAAALGRSGPQGASARAYARLALARGDEETVRRLLGESLAYNQESGNRREIAFDLVCLADDALRAGEAERARQLQAQALAFFRESGYRRGVALALAGLGEASGRANSGAGAAAARAHYAEALQTAQEIGAMPVVLSALVGLAGVAIQAGQLVPAVEALTCALYHPASNHNTLDTATRLLSQLENELPAPEVAAAEERGRRSRLQDAVAGLLAA